MSIKIGPHRVQKIHRGANIRSAIVNLVGCDLARGFVIEFARNSQESFVRCLQTVRLVAKRPAEGAKIKEAARRVRKQSFLGLLAALADSRESNECGFAVFWRQV